MSDTPRTDIEVEERVLECKNQPHTDWVTAFFARQLERELNALKAGQMTEEKAREVLGEWIDSNNWLCHKYKPIQFDDTTDGCFIVHEYANFTSLQLRAIAWWMDNKGGAR